MRIEEFSTPHHNYIEYCLRCIELEDEDNDDVPDSKSQRTA